MIPGSTDFSKAEVKYPVDWEYRMIVESGKVDSAREAASAALARFSQTVKFFDGPDSASGKYCTLRIPVRLESKKMSEELSLELSQIEGVKFLL